MQALQFFIDHWMVFLAFGMIISLVPFFIKIRKDDDGVTRIVIRQGRSDIDILQQPKEGFKTYEDAQKHKDAMIKEGKPFSFRKPHRYVQKGKMKKLPKIK